MPMTPAQIAEKWSRNMANSVQSYREGVNAVDSNPLEAASRAGERWQAAMARPETLRRFRSGLARFGTLQDWKTRTVEIGSARLASGAAAARPRVQAFFTRWMPILERNVTEVRAMPNTTFEERLQRMTRMATLSHEAAAQLNQ